MDKAYKTSPPPCRGRAREGVEASILHCATPTSRDTLLAKPADCGSGCEAAIPAPDASQRRVMAAILTFPHAGGRNEFDFKEVAK